MLKVRPAEVRCSVVEMLYRAKASHLGSNMSVIEMLIAVYSSLDCEKIRCRMEDRTRVLVSKGHCAAATYATMAHFDIFPLQLLETYHLNGSYLTGHVNHMVHGVEHSTGALGHGINVAVGCALGLRGRGFLDSKVFAILGDGEIQEGSVWEAMMLAAHKNLTNLITLVDNNRISSITKTHEVIDMRPLVQRFEGFGLLAFEVDGHNVSEITEAINNAFGSERPVVIICNTVKGRDIPFAEWEPIWHYKSLSEEQYTQAISHLNILSRT